MKTTSAYGAVIWNLGIEKAQPPTGLLGQAIPTLAIAADQPPGQTVLAVLFFDALVDVLLEERREVRVIADGMKIDLHWLLPSLANLASASAISLPILNRLVCLGVSARISA